MFGVKAAAACLVLAITAAAAWAEPCGGMPSRREMNETLGRAGEARPVNVTFQTRADGVEMPAYLLTQYPDEMTIILQYQFDRLSVGDDRFEVRLWFKGRAARLAIPFASVTAVYDNAVRKCFGE
jgi:Stringent starvation protein B